MLASNDTIVTQLVHSCRICGAEGSEIYSDLVDELFDVKGLWGMKQCDNEECKLLWAHPMPSLDSIPALYEDYYTHELVGKKSGVLYGLSELVASGYLKLRYGYFQKIGKIRQALGLFVYLLPGFRAIVDARVFGLGKEKKGKVLEIGCGAGRNLKILKSLGWDVEGIDLDQKAVKNALENGVEVHVGTLESKYYPDNSFDAVVSQHLIEHVPDPVFFLEECMRILKPGGVLKMYTPNALSLGHRFFKGNWRGLEPPRHLHVFSRRSLVKVTTNLGFIEISCNSTYAGAAIFLSSVKVMRPSSSAKRLLRIGALFLFQYFEWIAVKLNSEFGEEIVLKATKPAN